MTHARYGPLTLEAFKPIAQGGQLDIPSYYMLNWFGQGPLYYSLITDSDEAAPALGELKRVVQSLPLL